MLRNADVPAHPSVKTLESLVSGRLKRPDAGLVVRHLLSGCPRCAQIAARLWDLERPGRRPSSEQNLREEDSIPLSEREGVTAAEAVAQEELLKLAAELDNIRRKALLLSESLAPANEELSSEIRSVIRCVVHDLIEPAICSLQGGADYRPTLHPPEAGPSAMLIDEN